MHITKTIGAWWVSLNGEPYRLLFPLGALMGVFGVMLWPAFVYGWIDFYPGPLHARMAYIHIVFITGTGMLTLLIATRVLLGHSGKAPMIYLKWNSIRWVIGLLILAMATRVSADLIPSMKWSHYAYAAITWSVAVIIWLIRFSPYLAIKGEAS